MRGRQIPVRTDVAILLDKRRRANRDNSNRKCHCETRFLALTEIKEKVLPIIFSAECRRDFRLRTSKLVDAGDVAVAKCTQFICDLFPVFDFRANQPEGKDKWKGCDLRPGIRQVPIVIALTMFCAKTDRLITDEQSEHRTLACAPSPKCFRGCLRFSGVQLRWSHRLQVCVPDK